MQGVTVGLKTTVAAAKEVSIDAASVSYIIHLESIFSWKDEQTTLKAFLLLKEWLADR